MFEQTWQDLRLAWRALWRARAFAAAAVLTLATGIAGTTATFALVQGVLLRPLPVRDQDRLVVMWSELAGSGHWAFSTDDFDVLRRGSRTLAGAAGVGYNGALPVAIADDRGATYFRTASVTGNFFAVLGVEPLLGRATRDADNVAGAERVLVISHGLWQRRYGGAADVIGRRVLVQRQPFTIVGVMPRDVEYPRGVEAWTPIAAAMATRTNAAFQVTVDIIGRLAADATIAQATSELNTLWAQIAADPRTPRLTGLAVAGRPFVDLVVGDMRTAMLVLFGAVGLVLLIASANVANLLLLRGEARRSELAVRLALGAGRFTVARQMLAESVVLALTAGVVGLVVAWWTLQSLVALVPGGLVRAESVRMDAGVLVFAIALAFVASLLAGIVPALAASGSDLVSHLRSGGRGGSAQIRRSRRSLVVAQVALAVTTVAAAGLLTRSMMNLEAVGDDLEADRLTLVPLELPQPRYAERTRRLQFLEEMVRQLESAPGVRAATPVNATPFSGTGWDVLITAEGQTEQAAEANPLLNLESIHENYFAAFEVPLVRGRPFSVTDHDDTPAVAIISRDVADRIWPGEDPLGKRIKIGRLGDPDEWRTIVGVADATRYRELSEPRATLYLPAKQFLVTAQTMVVRSTSSLEVVGRLVRDVVASIDPEIQVMRAVTFGELLERPLARPRFNALLIGVFGGIALLLSCVGLYAVMAAHVRSRSREIGIRLALGATRADVRRLVLDEGLRLGVAGAGIGLACALGAAPLLRSLLYDVHPLDPLTMIAATLMLVGVCALASYLPARGATRIDPIAALRTE
jgi:putative ABC transport system permease protein